MAFSSGPSDVGAGLDQYMGSYVPRVATTSGVRRSFMNSPASFRLPPPDAHFQVPPLHCSFPPLLHPHYELVKKQCDGWVLDVAQPPSAAACQLLLQCLRPRLICRAIPAASSISRLVHVTKMVSWLTIADDDDDHPDALGADDNASRQHAKSVRAILRCREQDNIEPAERNGAMRQYPNQLSSDLGAGLAIDSRVALYARCSKGERKGGALAALSKLWVEMQREMPPNLRDRFVLAIDDYLQAVKVQAAFRSSHRLPTIEAYLRVRRDASFLSPCLALLEYGLGIELDEAAYNHPLLDKFRHFALDYVFLCNDLISCKMEIRVGDYFNLPSIAYSSSANKGWSFQDAIDHVANMVKDIDEQCVSMLTLIPQSSSPLLQHSDVRTYIVALCHGMSGCLAWFLETARYRT